MFCYFMLYEYISICRSPSFDGLLVYVVIGLRVTTFGFLTLRLENALIVNKQMNGLGDNNF